MDDCTFGQSRNYDSGLQNALVSRLAMELQRSRQQADKASRMMTELMQLQKQVCQETDASFVRLQEKLGVLHEMYLQSSKKRTSVRLYLLFTVHFVCLSLTHLLARHVCLLAHLVDCSLT